MKNKIFVVFSSGAEILSDAIKSCSSKTEVIQIDPILKTYFFRALRSVCLRYNLFKELWFYFEIYKFHILKKKYKNNTEFIAIIFDVPIWIINIHLFKKFFPIENIKFWFWNPIDRSRILNLGKITRNVSSVVSFDQKNCVKFNIKFIPQFYWGSSNKTKYKELYDIIYVGRSKNRLTQIENLFKQCKKLKLNVFFHVKKDFKDQVSTVFELKNENINYADYKILMQQSKVIAEFNSSEQAGLTLRPLEAIFYEKKLVTNNKEIKDYDFYTRENIFILGGDEELSKEFFETNVYPYNELYKYEYSFENWLHKISII